MPNSQNMNKSNANENFVGLNQSMFNSEKNKDPTNNQDEPETANLVPIDEEDENVSFPYILSIPDLTLQKIPNTTTIAKPE